ncbi:MAG TPA: hypothetical protein DEB39_13150 [Planctomycetaceae bacterium]|nr:hypothetical protein [Planctomycetaceae bacterium]
MGVNVNQWFRTAPISDSAGNRTIIREKRSENQRRVPISGENRADRPQGGWAENATDCSDSS